VACPADVLVNGAVDIADLLAVLSDWGECPASEPDPAGTLADATDLGPLDAAVIERCDRLEPADVDVFRFEVPTDGTVTLRLGDRQAGATMRLVADVDGDGAFGLGDSVEVRATAGPEDLEIVQALTPGTYWVRLESGVTFTTYALAASFEAVGANPVADPGAGLATATDLGAVAGGGPAVTVVQGVGPLDQRDVFAFELLEPARLAATASGITDPIRLAVGADVDASGSIVGNGSVASDEAVIFDTGGPVLDGAADLGPGIYWLIVNRFGALDGSTYAVDLNADAIPTTFDEDPGDTLAEAADLGTLGAAVIEAREVYGAYDRADIVAVTVDLPRRVTIDFAERTDGGRLELIADIAGDGTADPSDVVRTRSASGPADLSETVDLAPGTWWLRVGPQPAGATSRYALSLDGPALTVTPDSDPGAAALTAWPMGTVSGTPLVEREIVGPYDRVDAYRIDAVADTAARVICDERTD
ncbi:MAG: hypothetical protein AAGK32_13540, partial [Actinomycetota bacterium]